MIFHWRTYLIILLTSPRKQVGILWTSRQPQKFRRRRSQTYPSNQKQNPSPNAEHDMETRKTQPQPEKLQPSVHQTAALLWFCELAHLGRLYKDLRRGDTRYTPKNKLSVIQHCPCECLSYLPKTMLSRGSLNTSADLSSAQLLPTYWATSLSPHL